MKNLIKLEQRLIDEEIGSAGKLLDIGCATGENIIYFSQKCFEVTGFDLSEEMLKESKEKVEKLGLSIKLVKGNVCDMNMFKDNSFDYVLCMFTLMNLKDEVLQKQAINEMKRVCKLNGKIFIMVHNSDEGKVIFGDWFDKKFEYRIFNKDEIKNLIEGINLKIEKIDIVGEGKYIFSVCSKI